MNTEESKVDALYEISRRIQKGFEDIDHRLSIIAEKLEDISAGIESIADDIPNSIDKPEE